MTQNRRIAIFVDVQNIYYTTRQAFGRQFNYRALWQRIARQGTIVAATAYATQRGANQTPDAGQLKFQNALRHIGFEVKLKPYIQRRDGSAKGDWDVGITIDVLQATDDVDMIVLLSGDGDFDLLLDAVGERGVETAVYGVTGLTANSLINAAGGFFPIDDRLLM